MNIAFSLQKKLQMGGLFSGVPRIYDDDCTCRSCKLLLSVNIAEIYFDI